MKIKNFIQIVVSAPALVALVGVQFLTPIISEVKAEDQCPASQSSSHVVIRNGSASGPIIGQWNAGEDGNNFTHADIFVEPGIRLYVTSYTQGVELTNRSPGSTQRTTFASTIITPNDRPPLYRPVGFYFTKQSQAVYLTDPITQSGFISVGGTNSCWPVYTEPGPNVNDSDGASSVVIRVSTTSIPISCSVSTTTQSVDRGGSGAYTVVVTGGPSVTGPVVVSLTAPPAGVTAPNSTVVLDGTGNNQATSSMQVFVGSNVPVSPPPYALQFSATKNGQTVSCGQSELVVTDPLVPALTLVLSPPALVSEVPGTLEYILEARCINGFNRILTDLTVTHGFNSSVTSQILNPTAPFAPNTSITCGQFRKVKLTASEGSMPLDTEVDIFVSGTDPNTP